MNKKIASRENLKKIELLDINCFGCGPKNSKGLKMEFFSDENSVYSWISIPGYLCGWDNVVHGGILSTVLDEIMSWTAIHLLKKIVFTKTMTVDFFKSVSTESEITTRGIIKEQISEREAIVEGYIYNINGELCAQSNAKFALFSNEALKKISLFDEKIIEAVQPIFK